MTSADRLTLTSSRPAGAAPHTSDVSGPTNLDFHLGLQAALLLHLFELLGAGGDVHVLALGGHELRPGPAPRERVLGTLTARLLQLLLKGQRGWGRHT